MQRATATEHAKRLNYAREVVQRGEPLRDAVERLARTRGISPRQAYRYLHHARRLKAPVPVGDAKVAFTVKLSRRLVRDVRAYARATGCSLSDLVTRALAALLRGRRGRG